MDQFHRHVEHVGGNLLNLREKPLPHLNAALVDEDTAIALIDGDDRGRLFKLHQVVAGAVLDRDQASPRLRHLLFAIELVDLKAFSRRTGTFL